VVKTLQVDDQDLGEPIDCEVLLNVHLTPTLAALKARGHHPLRLDKLFETLLKLDTAQVADCLAGNFDAEVHKVVKGAVLKAAAETLRSIYELALEKICHN